MAKVIRRFNQNTAKLFGARFARICTPLAFFACGVFCVWQAWQHKQPWLCLGAAICAVLAWLCIKMLTKRIGILKSGITGETYIAELLAALPAAYTVLVNPVFVVNGCTAELDALVTGPCGVVIVEAKNHSGAISGHAEADTWTQTKQVKGAQAGKAMQNPLRQSARQVRLITRLLQANGIDSKVTGFVVFTNPRAKILVQNESLVLPSELCKAIRCMPKQKIPDMKIIKKL